MSPRRIDTDSDFSDDRCWPYGVGISQVETELASPRDYLSVEHVAPHELGANCRVVPMAVLVEWAARFDKLATRDAAEGANKTNADYLRDYRSQPDNGVIVSLEAATPKPAPDAVREATQAQHVGRPKGEPARFVRNGKLETCRCFDCRALAAPVPSPGGAHGSVPLATGAAEPVAWPPYVELPLTFWYKNHRGEEAFRTAFPISIRFGTTEYHSEAQWLLKAFDRDKQAEREFAMRDMLATPPVRG